MRKFLLGLTILAGGVVAASGADAAPRVTASLPQMSDAGLLQTVQYREDWRYREWRRHEEFERARRHAEWRHEEWRHERHEAREHEQRGW